MAKALAPQCCCAVTPLPDYIYDCNTHYPTPNVSLGVLGNYTIVRSCPGSSGSGLETAFTKRICFKLLPHQHLSALQFSFVINITNNNYCAVKVRAHVVRAVVVDMETCNCSFGSGAYSTEQYTIDARCTENKSFTVPFTGVNIDYCCKTQFDVELEVTCCTGTPTKDCPSSSDDVSLSVSLASHDDAWTIFPSGTVSLYNCGGNRCTPYRYTYRIGMSVTNNVAGVCAEVLVRVNNIFPGGSCVLKEVRDSESCNTLRQLPGLGPDGAHYVFCFAGTGTLTAYFLVTIDDISDCCDQYTAFDVEYRARCLDASNANCLSGSPRSLCCDILDVPSCPSCGGS